MPPPNFISLRKIAVVVRDHFIPVFTGGYTHQPSISDVANLTHLYTWLLLWFLPLVLEYSELPSSDNYLLVWIGYAILIFLFFLTVKIILWWLDHSLKNEDTSSERQNEIELRDIQVDRRPGFRVVPYEDIVEITRKPTSRLVINKLLKSWTSPRRVQRRYTIESGRTTFDRVGNEFKPSMRRNHTHVSPDEDEEPFSDTELDVSLTSRLPSFSFAKSSSSSPKNHSASPYSVISVSDDQPGCSTNVNTDPLCSTNATEPTSSANTDQQPGCSTGPQAIPSYIIDLVDEADRGVFSETLKKVCVMFEGPLATCPEDDTPGCVHVFRDECGSWMAYAMRPEAQPVNLNVMMTETRVEMRSVAAAEPTAERPQFRQMFTSILSGHIAEGAHAASPFIQEDAYRKHDKRSHRVRLFRFSRGLTTLNFDRFSLETFVDSVQNVLVLFLHAALAGCVAFVSGLLLHLGVYSSWCKVVFCFVSGSALYSLFKSPQPDSSTSQFAAHHSLSCYNRAAYFLILSIPLCLIHWFQMDTAIGFHFYTFDITLGMLVSFIDKMILILPILFTIGIMPNLTTFGMVLLESVNIHLFGGSGIIDVKSGVMSVIQSVCVVGLIWPVSFFIVSRDPPNQALVSLFFALVVGLTYQMSRIPSHVALLWKAIFSITCQTSVVKKCSDQHVKFPAVTTTNPFNFDEEQLGDSSKSSEETDEKEVSARVTDAVACRLRDDVFLCLFLGVLVFSINVSGLFTPSSIFQPHIDTTLIALVALLGFIKFYVLPQLTSPMPFLLFQISSTEDFQSLLHAFGSINIECIHLVLSLLNQTVCVAALLSSITLEFIEQPRNKNSKLVWQFDDVVSSLVVSVCVIKSLRLAFRDSSFMWIILPLTKLWVAFDSRTNAMSETFLIDYFVAISIFVVVKAFIDKFSFVLCYNAAFNWGAFCHAFACPIIIPHVFTLILCQCMLAAVISAPVIPVLGSTLFVVSYPRCLKFWEKNYEEGDTAPDVRLSEQLKERGNVEGKWDCVFYEALARSLQLQLAGDNLSGRLGFPIKAGDVLLLSTDEAYNMTAFVHIIETSGTLVVFQLRGLELTETYCAAREREIVTNRLNRANQPQSPACCLCPNALRQWCGTFFRRITREKHVTFFTLATYLKNRLQAWRITTPAYSITTHTPTIINCYHMFETYDLQRRFAKNVSEVVIFLTLRHANLVEWLHNDTLSGIIDGMDATVSNRAPKNGQFCRAIHRSRLSWVMGSDRNDDARTFLDTHAAWIRLTASRHLVHLKQQLANQLAQRSQDEQEDAVVMRTRQHIDILTSIVDWLVVVEDEGEFSKEWRILNDFTDDKLRQMPRAIYLLWIFTYEVRSCIAQSCGGGHAKFSMNCGKAVLMGVYSILSGNLRFDDMTWLVRDFLVLHDIVKGSVALSLKHHLLCVGTGNDSYSMSELRDKIDQLADCADKITICCENDPDWRSAMARNVPQLMALRYLPSEQHGDEPTFKLINVQKRYERWTLARINSECVRGLWAGQQKELIVLKNQNTERGSIQNSGMTFRNMIGSSCDPPIGYPIYVSPLLTSIASLHPSLSENVPKISRLILSDFVIIPNISLLFNRVRNFFKNNSYFSSSSNNHPDIVQLSNLKPIPPSTVSGNSATTKC